MRRIAFSLSFVLLASVSTEAVAERYSTQVSLGRALFEDKNLSADRTVACASCHEASQAFCDGRAVSTGVASRVGTRNAPSLLTLREHTAFFWDGRAQSLEEQARFPFLNPVEMGLSSDEAVLNRVRENANYIRAFHSLQKKTADRLALTDVIGAIVAYEHSLPASVTPLDLYLAGEKAALSRDAEKGLALFHRAGCSSCHLIDDRSAPLTDNGFHESSIGLREVGADLSSLAITLVHAPTQERFAQVATDSRVAALGRFIVTLNVKDIGMFRTPSLRDVARTAPYMHDGSIATLEEAIDRELYYRGLQQGYPVNLSIEERHQLRLFLMSASLSPSRPPINDQATQATAARLQLSYETR